MQLVKFFLAIIMMALVTACATLNKSECLIANWEAIGYEDGSKGYLVDKLGQHRKACAKHGVAPDVVAYRAGRDSGLKVFCVPRNGFLQGKGGRPLTGVCKGEAAVGFEKAYLDGRKIYQAQQKVNATVKAVQEQENIIVDISEHITAAEAELVSDGVGSPRRVELLDEIKQLNADLIAAESDMVPLQNQLARDQQTLERVKAQSFY